MKRLVPLLVVLGICGSPLLAQSYYISPDVPTDLGGSTYLPWELVRVDSGAFSPHLALPAGTAVDALHAMCVGDWLFSVEAPTELPPGGGVFFEPRDVVRVDPAWPSTPRSSVGDRSGSPTAPTSTPLSSAGTTTTRWCSVSMCRPT